MEKAMEGTLETNIITYPHQPETLKGYQPSESLRGKPSWWRDVNIELFLWLAWKGFAFHLPIKSNCPEAEKNSC